MAKVKVFYKSGKVYDYDFKAMILSERDGFIYLTSPQLNSSIIFQSFVDKIEITFESEDDKHVS